MDKSWIDLPHRDPAYYDGCMKFVELAREKQVNGQTRCLCNKCKLNKWLPIDDVGGHILFDGFYKKYKDWNLHSSGEGSNAQELPSYSSDVIGRDDMEAMLKDAFMGNIPKSTVDCLDHSCDKPHIEDENLHDMDEFTDFPYEEDDEVEVPCHNTNEEEAKFKKLLKASSEPLYEGCSTFSKLCFLLNLFHLKCLYHWSAESFTKFLQLHLDAFPHIKEFPSSYYEGMKLIKDLGLGYQKIHACPNNCMLYWGEYVDKDECHVCHTSRWKTVKGKEGDTSNKGGIAPNDWFKVVDFWFSEKGQQLSEIGKEARSQQCQAHTMGSKSYTNLRADYEEEHGEEMGLIQCWEKSHKRKDGTFVKDTITEDFLHDAKSKVEVLKMVDPSTSRVDLEDQAFHHVLNGGEIPERPQGFGFGVKKSDIYGVRGLLKKQGSRKVQVNSMDFDVNFAYSALHKRNEVLEKKNKELSTKCDKNNKMLHTVVGQFSKILNAMRNGTTTRQLFDAAQSALEVASQEVNDDDDAACGDGESNEEEVGPSK